MGQITGGRVSFTRTVRPADFESKSATVDLTFDDVDVLDKAAEMAKAKALQMVDLQVRAAQVAAGAAATTVAPKADKPPKDTTAADKKKAAAAARMNAADKKPAEEAGGDDLDGLDPKPQISEGGERKDPAQSDADDDLLGDEAPKDITDKDVTDAVQRFIAAAGEGAPAKVKELRNKFVQPPKGLRDIPQDKRKDFLDQLAALKK